MSMSLTTDDRLVRAVKKTVPNLSTPKHKGQDGRIGIVGGSMEYTGAPYFAGMSALRLGADLVHIFCTKDASVPIKCLSPDLIVHPVLDHPTPVKAIKPWLDRLHVLIIGCGLGREEKNMKTVVELIGVCRYLKKPLVIDADGLFIIGMKPDLLKDYPGVILTPNAMEFSRLFNSFLDRSIQPASLPKAADVKLLADSIGKNVVILHKGAKDIIADGNKTTETVTSGLAGSGRRCGGQGDIMAGILAVFWWWAINAGPSDGSLSPQMTACYGASRMTRECNSATFKIKQRSMLASDMLEQIEPVFAKLFENNSTKVVVTPRSSSFSRRNRTRSSDM